MTSHLELIRPSQAQLSETFLRQKLLFWLEKMDVTAAQPLHQLLEDFSKRRFKKPPNILLAQAVRLAKRSKRWGVNGLQSQVNIGFYQNEADYYTILFHEAAHTVLRVIDLSFSAYEENSDLEEVFCWELSQLVAQLLDFPYAPETAAIQLAISRWHLQLRTLSTSEIDTADQQLKQLVLREQEILGFSIYADDDFYWDEQEMPVKVAY